MKHLPLQTYALFHLNLAYSSISVEQRKEVVHRCYWPLLQLARKLSLPLAVEASAYTLETIAEIDPEWLSELRLLVTQGPCEFIGSGYAQLIGPLVPAAVNAANLRLGNDIYIQLLGFRPQVALVNEQAYSAGIVSNYLDAGYRAIIMDWNNPARCHPEWNSEWRYLPQYAQGSDGREIPLIWNNSIFFQKFQRYAHGEMDLEEYGVFIHSHRAGSTRVFPLYGNDVEIFDFRPGRYHTEAELHDEGEWQRIEKLFAKLVNDSGVQLIVPGAVLQQLGEPGAGNKLHLESAREPVPVKKQEKYNASRWSVTGRDDLGINTACWRIYAAIKDNATSGDESWRELCYLWSSDFRTHITGERWQEYLERLRACEKLVDTDKCKSRTLPSVAGGEVNTIAPGVRVEMQGHILELETSSVRLRLNCRRGLAIDALWFKEVTDTPFCGTLPHGFFDDISLGADFYTGHLVLETPAQPRITDLVPVTPSVTGVTPEGVVVTATIATQFGDVEKRISIIDGKVALTTRLNWQEVPLGSLRLAIVTLNPHAFDRNTLFYRTHNGGLQAETFLLSDNPVNHGETASFLVSAKQVLGVTEGIVEFGDGQSILRLTVDKMSAALVGLVTFRPVGESYFVRCSFSAGEMDETSRSRCLNEPLVCTMALSARRRNNR